MTYDVGLGLAMVTFGKLAVTVGLRASWLEVCWNCGGHFADCVGRSREKLGLWLRMSGDERTTDVEDLRIVVS